MVFGGAENNTVTISGKIFSEPTFSHELYGEGFFHFLVEVPRLSESSDKIPVMVSERLAEKTMLEIGRFVEIEGQFRSYNSYQEEGSKLVLTVFAREVSFKEGVEQSLNNVILNGFICKKPIYRKTPFGREIADILLAVNRNYNKSDYIPCIMWGRNAKFCEALEVGDNIKIWGRIQSRNYQKKSVTGELISKTAFEISVAKMEILRRKNHNHPEPYFDESQQDESQQDESQQDESQQDDT